ncbi:MAG: DUF6335 family protein [Fischerella sp.]|nr:DUF6335 family protein [Fischerella sp.]
MVGKKPSDAVNHSLTQWEAKSEELLLADIVGTDDTDPIFEELVESDTGMERILKRWKNPLAAGGDVTGGDPDDDWYQAEVVGEEAVGGENPTPDQNVTEDLLHSMGITSVEGRPVDTLRDFYQRDCERWELDPESCEDYQEHWE